MALFSLLSEIDSRKTSWAIKARVVRLYREPLFKRPEEIGSIEMVIHDSTGQRIHVSMKANIMDNLEKKIDEGSVYIIKNFLVVEDKNTLKTTTNRYRLILFRATHMKVIEDTEFPYHMHNFRNFNQLSPDNEIDEHQLIDVMGRIVSYKQPNNVFGLSSKRMDFCIDDNEGRQLSCSLWSEYVDDLFPILENSEDKSVVISILFAKVSRFRDDIKISNISNVTKVTINGEGDNFIDLKKNLKITDNGWSKKVLTDSNYEIYDAIVKRNSRFRTLGFLNNLHDVRWVILG
ncbi:hypothetical protein CASFOL_001226 [Castilleja foliolosa]|uniref:Replication protein A 70 kDa DNA-binding subunit B/D first OB fold domain-containing protein n=1 Tax=Castilleja foliolosa TaxID=1961234 RepID=A0ABD3EM02_9LAMI